MATDHFASNITVLVLSWIVAIPAFCMVMKQLEFLFQKPEGASRKLGIWIGLCFLFLSPIRYLWFLLILAIVYPFQSFPAFFSLMGIGLLGPFALGLLYCLSLVLPLQFVHWIAGSGAANRTKRNTVAAAFLAPFIAFAATIVFSVTLPVAAWTTRGLNADDLIRATNGPAYCAFCCAPSGVISLPPYIRNSNATLKDSVRAHVAFVYLSKSKEAYFLKTAYPWLVDDEAIQDGLDMNFKYQPDGTPTLTKTERCALAILYEKGALSDKERRAYRILILRGIVNPAKDSEPRVSDQTSAAVDLQSP